MHIVEDRPVRVSQGGQQASIQPAGRITEELSMLQAMNTACAITCKI